MFFLDCCYLLTLFYLCNTTICHNYFVSLSNASKRERLYIIISFTTLRLLKESRIERNPTWFASLSYTSTTQYLLTLQLRLRWLQTMSCSCETNSNKSHQRRRFSANHFQSLLGSRDISRAFHASWRMDQKFWLVYGYFYVLQLLTFWQSDSSITSNKEQPRVIFLRLNCST